MEPATPPHAVLGIQTRIHLSFWGTISNPNIEDLPNNVKMALPRLTTPANVRTVIVKVNPTPATLSERRAVLRALKQHGEIQVFKKLHVRLPVSTLYMGY